MPDAFAAEEVQAIRTAVAVWEAGLAAVRDPGPRPHKFRHTVATAINESADVEVAAELLGHTSSKITIQHYIRRNEMVNPATADLPEQAFAPVR